MFLLLRGEMRIMRELEVSESLVKQAQREYHKQWRDRNKEKIRDYNKKFWAKKALEKLQKGDLNGEQQ